MKKSNEVRFFQKKSAPKHLGARIEAESETVRFRLESVRGKKISDPASPITSFIDVQRKKKFPIDTNYVNKPLLLYNV